MMFSFHKPKVYRSSTGCCICKAKSSSSRFTDSKKYEEDFLECFQLGAPRQGEICNACVLLVKRWKKLPAGSDRNWRHVVDARAGPGMKSMTKFKLKNRRINYDPMSSSSPSSAAAAGGGGGGGANGSSGTSADKVEKIMRKKKRKLERETSPALSDQEEDMDFLSESGPSAGSSRNASPGASDCEDNGEPQLLPSTKGRRQKAVPKKRTEQLDDRKRGCFIDPRIWKKETTCCGTIYRGPNDRLIIDITELKPCEARLAIWRSASKARPHQEAVQAPEKASDAMEASDQTAGKAYSDSSSDSGYDESSNPAVDKDNNFSKMETGEIRTTTTKITTTTLDQIEDGNNNNN